MHLLLMRVLLVAAAAASLTPRQEVPFAVTSEEVIEYVRDAWPDKTLVINSEVGDPEYREAWAAELRSIAALKDLELISLADACDGEPDMFPHGPCFFSGARGHVVIHFLRTSVSDAGLLLDFRMYVQEDPAEGLAKADRRAIFQQTAEGGWVLSRVMTL